QQSNEIDIVHSKNLIIKNKYVPLYQNIKKELSITLESLIKKRLPK
ncbi:18018_t:CDS:1, partial [Gigaspora margarita]